jgi:hypothetical protein
MEQNTRRKTYALWIAGVTIPMFVIGLITWTSVPMGPWFLWLVLSGVLLGFTGAYIDNNSIQGR